MTGATIDNAAGAGRLAGRRIVITGAASGIGRATARHFASEGATVILLDRNGDGLAETLGTANGVTATVEITDEAALERAIHAAAQRAGGIDGVINAAGIMPTGLIDEVPVTTWRKTIEVNLTGTFLVVRACLPYLKQASGSTISNIASGAGILPNAPGLTAYAASKGGVVTLTRALAAELAPGIRVNCVCPGMVDTPMADGFRQNVGNYALKRLADPLEIARALLYLTSSESSYVTGAALAVDGGRTFH
jgi:NAD(P)-dependent dehydrogenase (short-subunit alcohol dehydrogenase family)